MKRFYSEVRARADQKGAIILLDERVVQTPARRPLLVPTGALAEAIATEWRAQEAELRVHEMVLTRLATTVVDLMPTKRDDAIAEAAGYGSTDLLCYRASAPRDLVNRQETSWQPWLDWATRELDAHLAVTRRLEPVEQGHDALAALRRAVAGLDDWRLVGVHALTGDLGSLVLALAMARGELRSEEALEVALLDELYEVEQWGAEEEQIRRHARLRREIEGAERFLRALDVAR